MVGFFYVMLGGSLGAALRYAAGLLVGSGVLATLWLNLLGSFLLGVLAAVSLARNWTGEEGLWLFLGVGVLGAFTTYSAFSRETALMLLNDQTLKAAGYILINALGAVAAFLIGYVGLKGMLS